MKSIFLVAVILLSTNAFAQDIDLGLGGDASSLLNIPAPRGNAPARGPAPNRGATAPAVDRFARLRQLLAQANTPLSAEQESALNTLIATEIPVMRRALQTRVADLQKANGATTPGQLPSMDELTPEIIRLNDQLFRKIAAAPQLNEQQQRILTKLYKDQVKSRGGFDAIKMTMDDGGSPFTPEQIAQIQPLFEQQSQAKAQLAKESQGQPEKAKMDQLQRETLSKVLKLLTPGQRSILLSPPKP